MCCVLHNKEKKAKPGQSGQRSTDKVQTTERNLGRKRFFVHGRTGPGAHAAPYKMGTACLFRGQSGRGVALTTLPHLEPRLKKE